MKLLDDVFSKAVEESSSYKALAEGVKLLACRMRDIALLISKIATQQRIQNDQVQQMWAMQQAMLALLKGSGVDSKLPSVATSASKKTEKPS